jgi:hypothetical protein
MIILTFLYRFIKKELSFIKYAGSGQGEAKIEKP